MAYVQHRMTEIPGMRIHSVETKKYKTNTIVLQLKNLIKEDSVTKRALLPNVMQSGTEKYPSSKQLRGALDDLYGATLNVDLSKKGNYQIISFRMDIANEKFLSDQSKLLDQGIALLADVLLRPVTENGAFKEDIVSKEKRSLKQQIESIYDDKMRYANKRLIEEMFKGDPYHLNVYGNENEVDQITPQDLYAYYQEVLANDEFDFYVVGDISHDEIVNKAKQFFVFNEKRAAGQSIEKNEAVEVTKVNEVIEEQDVQQGKLHMGLRTYTTYADPDYLALQVCNGIFGGFSHSKLFINVREKHSLAYYAASRFESHKGSIFVMSGIETANYEKTVSIIKEQLEDMRNGNITDDEMAKTKAMIKNQILETVDDAAGLVEVLYHQIISGYERSIEEWINGIDRVTKDEVVEVAKKIKLDTIYFLKGRGNENGTKTV
ncbi:pitrilysin family protein [Fictibacillus sp. Mic-4]|uniref:EF-P 5-aminopentanol modification-associated protein YfmF n=1 Tax=Fictibacillus sp. Mic-4 TaxID=3132826 RepID=UPI003CF59127